LFLPYGFWRPQHPGACTACMSVPGRPRGGTAPHPSCGSLLPAVTSAAPLAGRGDERVGCGAGAKRAAGWRRAAGETEACGRRPPRRRGALVGASMWACVAGPPGSASGGQRAARHDQKQGPATAPPQASAGGRTGREERGWRGCHGAGDAPRAVVPPETDVHAARLAIDPAGAVMRGGGKAQEGSSCRGNRSFPRPADHGGMLRGEASIIITALEPTASSVRSSVAPAFGGGSPLALASYLVNFG
jgi:hypothetical protein